MKLFSLNFASLILRFYLLMAIIIGAYFLGYPILAFLALPVFISAMMGIKFTRTKKAATATSKENTKTSNVQHQTAH